MTNKLFTIIIISIIFLFSGMMKAQELYYWSGEKKHFLVEDRKAIILSVKEGEDMDVLIKWFSYKI